MRLGKVRSLLHNNSVVSQVVMLREPSGSLRFSSVDNPGNKRPTAFENRDAGVFIPRLGSQDLLDIALWASRTGYHVDLIDFADDSMNRLDETVNEEVSARVMQVLLEQGTDAALDLLDAEFSGHSVIGVHLTDGELDSIMVGRSGVVWADDDVSVVEFFSRAWGATHFS
jgi:hypothetical protein